MNPLGRLSVRAFTRRARSSGVVSRTRFESDMTGGSFRRGIYSLNEGDECEFARSTTLDARDDFGDRYGAPRTCVDEWRDRYPRVHRAIGRVVSKLTVRHDPAVVAVAARHTLERRIPQHRSLFGRRVCLTARCSTLARVATQHHTVELSLADMSEAVDVQRTELAIRIERARTLARREGRNV